MNEKVNMLEYRGMLRFWQWFFDGRKKRAASLHLPALFETAPIERRRQRD
ncbi:hypothetical protein [Duganella sp. S19_KUP01_CR8]